jgi:acyl-CoA synthetase (AMP-forming)/AMP-acid ligase II
MDMFYADELEKLIVTWDDFIEQINSSKTYNKLCYHQSIYSIFKHITLSIIHEKSIILLDSDFTSNEIENLTGVKQIKLLDEQLPEKFINSKDELLSLIKSKSSNKWDLTLFTSGTTGIPKQVTHGFASLTRNVKISERHKWDVWGFAYNPTHMAGLQVFFQAIMNGNTIVRLFNLNPGLMFQSVEKYAVTHISATPTFYKTFLASNRKFPMVKSITTGGERYNESLTIQLKKIFPNAKFKNIYALTEAGSLFTSEGETFIVDDVANVKIENGHLLINRSLLGNFSIELEWYDTGDLVEIVSTYPLRIKFLTREKELINVGGYKVNPHEVEQYLLEIDRISNAVVYAKKNSVLGNIVVADVIAFKPLTEQEIREFLSSKIQEYKIPRIIRFVDKIEISRTGKTKRI